MPSDPLHVPVAPLDPHPAARVVLTRDEYAALVAELESVRAAHRADLAGRLRDVRAHGVTGDNDELLMVMEESAIDRARIARLEELVRCAVVVDEHTVPADGRAGLGSTVRVRDEAGATTEYRLVGRRTAESARREVTLASPIGKALAGARTGDVLAVSLPSGRDRRLTVLGVRGAAVPSAEAA